MIQGKNQPTLWCLIGGVDRNKLVAWKITLDLKGFWFLSKFFFYFHLYKMSIYLKTLCWKAVLPKFVRHQRVTTLTTFLNSLMLTTLKKKSSLRRALDLSNSWNLICTNSSLISSLYSSTANPATLVLKTLSFKRCARSLFILLCKTCFPIGNVRQIEAWRVTTDPIGLFSNILPKANLINKTNSLHNLATLAFKTASFFSAHWFVNLQQNRY